MSRRPAQPAKPDWYAILEVPRNASEDDLRKAYKRLALRWHPDKNENSSESTAMFQKISEAYSVLSDPQKRARYDRGEPDDEDSFHDFGGRSGGIDISELFAAMFAEQFMSGRGGRGGRGGPFGGGGFGGPFGGGIPFFFSGMGGMGAPYDDDDDYDDEYGFDDDMEEAEAVEEFLEMNTTKVKSGKGRAAKTKWKCNLCGKQFSKRHTTFDHMQTVHDDELNDFLDSRLGEEDEDFPQASSARPSAGAAPRAAAAPRGPSIDPGSAKQPSHPPQRSQPVGADAASRPTAASPKPARRASTSSDEPMPSTRRPAKAAVKRSRGGRL